jgi:hypothetical protein
MLKLTINHNIYVSREQSYLLHQGKEIITIGASVPVWFYNKVSSEPAIEVFCKYYIKNPKKEIPIKILEDGYEINLPFEEKSIDSKEISSKSLLDICDGGSEFLNYRELNKVLVKDKTLSIMHYVTINRLEKIEKTLN